MPKLCSRLTFTHDYFCTVKESEGYDKASYHFICSGLSRLVRQTREGKRISSRRSRLRLSTIRVDYHGGLLFTQDDMTKLHTHVRVYLIILVDAACPGDRLT